MSLAPGTRLGSYEVVSILGVGGMGEVYRARDRKLNRDVAIKVLLAAVVTIPNALYASVAKRRCWRHSIIPTSLRFTASKIRATSAHL